MYCFVFVLEIECRGLTLARQALLFLSYITIPKGASIERERRSRAGRLCVEQGLCPPLSPVFLFLSNGNGPQPPGVSFYIQLGGRLLFSKLNPTAIYM